MKLRLLIPIIGLSMLLACYILVVWIIIDCTFGSGRVLVTTVGVGGFVEEAADIVTLLTTLPFVILTAERLAFPPVASQGPVGLTAKPSKDSEGSLKELGEKA